MPIMSIIKRVLIDSFKRKEECEPNSQDFKTSEEFIEAALEDAEKCEHKTYEEFKNKQ